MKRPNIDDYPMMKDNKLQYYNTDMKKYIDYLEAENKQLKLCGVINSDSDVCPNAKKCKIIMFTSDLDICQKCNKTFDGK